MILELPVTLSRCPCCKTADRKTALDADLRRALRIVLARDGIDLTRGAYDGLCCGACGDIEVFDADAYATADDTESGFLGWSVAVGIVLHLSTEFAPIAGAPDE